MWADLHSYITAHEQIDENRVCYFRFFGVFLASRGSSLRTYLSSLQLVLCRVAAVIRLSVHHHSADYIFSGSLRSLSSFCVRLKIEVR